MTYGEYETTEFIGGSQTTEVFQAWKEGCLYAVKIFRPPAEAAGWAGKEDFRRG